MGETSSDSQRAWELLVEWLKNLQAAQQASTEADAEAWREYRLKCESYDKALASLKADIATVKTDNETAALKAKLASNRDTFWLKMVPAIASGIAIVVAALGGLNSKNTSDYVRGWRRPRPLATDSAHYWHYDPPVVAPDTGDSVP